MPSPTSGPQSVLLQKRKPEEQVESRYDGLRHSDACSPATGSLRCKHLLDGLQDRLDQPCIHIGGCGQQFDADPEVLGQ